MSHPHPLAYGALWALTHWMYSASDECPDLEMSTSSEVDAERVRRLREDTGVELRDVYTPPDIMSLGCMPTSHVFDDTLFVLSLIHI